MIERMAACMVKDCNRPATRGQAWTDEPLDEIGQYQKGIQLSLTVHDIAVRLALCDGHAQELTAAAWRPVLTLLDEWGWHPLRSGHQNRKSC
jgi:hypothetical protein